MATNAPGRCCSADWDRSIQFSMATSALPTYTAQSRAPFMLRQRRTPIACSNCRAQKIKCKAPDETSAKACQRCTLRGLPCEYVPVSRKQKEEVGSESIVGTAPAQSSHQRKPRGAVPSIYTGLPPFPPHHGFAPSTPGLTDACYSDSSLAGWAGFVSAVGSHTASTPCFLPAHDNSHHGNPSQVVDPECNLTIHLNHPLDRISPMPAPATYYPQDQFVQPSTVGEFVWGPDASLAWDLKAFCTLLRGNGRKVIVENFPSNSIEQVFEIVTEKQCAPIGMKLPKPAREHPMQSPVRTTRERSGELDRSWDM
ncbi:hypothetical protein FB451DRAFT_1189474 [Mycena latifolia]|nr:hypothetical protein FB451DRAFT_1189474 [Mycena latifolia]